MPIHDDHRTRRTAGWRAAVRTVWPRLLLAPLLLAGLVTLLPHLPGNLPVSAAPALNHLPSRPHPAVAAPPARHGSPMVLAVSRSVAATREITIAPGDTLWSLAGRYHTSVALLQALNELGTATLIYAGAPLWVPAGSAQPAITPQLPSTGPPPSAGPPPAGASPAAQAIAYARAQLGKPYVWGGTGPGGYDCSGLVMRAWQAAGVQLPRVTYDQVNAGTHISRSQLSPGDLVFSNNVGHVQMYLGHGQVIQAPQPGQDVDIVPLPPPWLVDAYVHISPPASAPGG